MSTIKTPADFGRALKQPYAWPGGYPTYFVTSDGAALCHACGRKHGALITSSIREHSVEAWRGADGWRVAALDVNWEDSELCCDHCSKAIESAYDKTEQDEMDAQAARLLGSSPQA